MNIQSRIWMFLTQSLFAPIENATYKIYQQYAQNHL